MKKWVLITLLSIITYCSNAQLAYYKGEWTMIDQQDLFTGIFKISLKKDGTVSGQLVWTYQATDSTDNNTLALYKGKRKGTIGIENVEGHYTAATRSIYFEGIRKVDPDEVIGLDKYTLKLSNNKQVIYGTTATGGSNKGLFYAVKINNQTGEKEFNAATTTLKKKSAD